MRIPYQKYTFTIEALEELQLPYYKGSTFRGGLGNILKKIVCVLKKFECTECMFRSKCIYAYFFETPSFEGAKIMNMHKYEKVPHPFVIEPPLSEINSKESKIQIIPPGSKIEFTLILIGKAIDYLPYFIYSFEELGKKGIGRKKGKYKLIEVSIKNKNLDPEKIIIYHESEKKLKHISINEIEIPDDFIPIDNVSKITLHLITPLRIKYKRCLVTNPEFHILVRNLIRRLSLLYYFHCNNKKPIWDYKAIIKYAEHVKIETSEIKWFDWERYSFRQNTRMKLGGLIGKITYKGNIKSFLPILQAGEILHVGKNTSFGLGKYQLIF